MYLRKKSEIYSRDLQTPCFPCFTPPTPDKNGFIFIPHLLLLSVNKKFPKWDFEKFQFVVKQGGNMPL